MRKYLPDDGFEVKAIFLVNYDGDKYATILKTDFWLPFPPTVGLVLSFQGMEYPPIQVVKYHVGTNKFTVALENSTVWDYNKADVLNLYSSCEEIKNDY